MARPRLVSAIGLGAILLLASGADIPAAAQRLTMPPSAVPSGAKLFNQQCAACHSLVRGETRVGPSLFQISGRRAGTVLGFGYSPALKKSQFRWDTASLDRWLTDTSVAVPGNSMAYRQADPAKRKLIIDYILGASAR